MTVPGTTSARQALTTPFVPPQSCIDQFRTTSFISSFSWNGFSTTTVRVLVSEEAESCLPTGWDGARQQSELQPSPAVCPSAWTAYDLGGTVSVERPPVTQSKTASTAFCCSSGFTLSYLFGIPVADTAANACFEPITITLFLTTTNPDAQTTSTVTIPNPFPYGLRVHEAWHITWEASDVSTLRPPPPDLGSCTTIALSTWVPEAPVDPDSLVCRASNDGTSHGSSSDTALFRFLVIGIPVIGVVAAVFGAVLCWRRRRRKRNSDQRVTGDISRETRVGCSQDLDSRCRAHPPASR